MTPSYKYNNVRYYCKIILHNNYKVEYELFKFNGNWCATIESYDNDINFKDKFKKNCEDQLLTFIDDSIKNNTIKDLINQGFNIRYEYENVLLSVNDINIGFHVSSIKNRNKILQEGIIANKNPNREVQSASYLIDSHKPFYIPNWVDRKNSVYLSPEISNNVLTSKDVYQNCDLYAVHLHPELCWVGSQGLGGFCLNANMLSNLEEEYRINLEKQLKQYAKLYWKYSSSLSGYIKNNRLVQYKNKQYGLDEILALHPIPSNSIELIGSWDKNSNFHINSNFTNYVKFKFKNQYIDILNKY